MLTKIPETQYRKTITIAIASLFGLTGLTGVSANAQNTYPFVAPLAGGSSTPSEPNSLNDCKTTDIGRR